MWVKIDDGFATHPKIIGLSDRAFRVHVSAICYAGQHLTDGRIPTGAVAWWGKRPVVELVKAGLWEDVGNGYALHDFLVYNPTRERVLTERDSAKRRRNVGRTSGDVPASVERASAVPSRPVPRPEKQPPKSLAASPLANGKQAERIALKDAIVASVGWDPSWMTKASWGEVENAAKQLHDVDADPADLPRFASLWSSHYHGIDLTPSAIAKHWPAFAAGTFARNSNRGRR